jgi:chaperonin GroES
VTQFKAQSSIASPRDIILSHPKPQRPQDGPFNSNALRLALLFLGLSLPDLQSTALKSIKSLMPLLDRVLVQRAKAEAKTAGGIFLPESSVKELNEAKVLAVGPGGLDKEGKRITMSVGVGDKVLIPQVCLDGEECKFLGLKRDR